MNTKLKILLTSLSLLVISATTVGCKSTPKDTYTPPKSDAVLNNPLMGLAPDAQYTDYNQSHKLVYANIYLNELEPKKGYYDFNYIEKKYNFNYWRSKDVKIILRLIMDYPNPSNKMYIPNWLYNDINHDGTWYDIPYGKGFSPNYENKDLIKYHEDVIRNLATRYNNSSDIAFIVLGSIGHWGEWHTYQDNDFSIPFPNQKIADVYASHYIKYFDRKKLLMRRPFKVASKNNFGLFNDMLGNALSTNEFISWFNNGYTDWITKIKQPSMKDFWKYAPSGGEFADGNSGLNFIKNFSIDNTIKQVKDTHITYIGPNCPANSGSNLQNNLNKLLKTLGYRYTINSTKYNNNINKSNTLSIDVDLDNEGVAPFYYNWPVNISIIDSNNNLVFTKDIDEDITKWLPGNTTFSTSIKLPSSIGSGNYKISISILDPSNEKEGIKFANDTEVIPYHFTIGNLTIK